MLDPVQLQIWDLLHCWSISLIVINKYIYTVFAFFPIFLYMFESNQSLYSQKYPNGLLFISFSEKKE